jgi:hypothetical protein
VLSHGHGGKYKSVAVIEEDRYPLVVVAIADNRCRTVVIVVEDGYQVVIEEDDNWAVVTENVCQTMGVGI